MQVISVILETLSHHVDYTRMISYISLLVVTTESILSTEQGTKFLSQALDNDVHIVIKGSKVISIEKLNDVSK